MRLFTWYDIEVELKKKRNLWPEWWNRIDVYSDEIVINIDTEKNSDVENEKVFKELFGKFYMNGRVMVEFDQKTLEVIYEEGDESDKVMPVKTPLFKDIYTRDEGETRKKDLSGSSIAVFHSYKGGVGRTLSLISLVREISETYGNQKKVLMIDADMEAPGLTWMLGQGNSNEKISYFDILELLSLNAGQVFDRERIYETIWGLDGDGNSDTVMEHIRKIRAKLTVHTLHSYIETVWGCGYRWNG